eukprot:8805185-Alexandrium_andersonii.AAC.1
MPKNSAPQVYAPDHAAMHCCWTLHESTGPGYESSTRSVRTSWRNIEGLAPIAATSDRSPNTSMLARSAQSRTVPGRKPPQVGARSIQPAGPTSPRSSGPPAGSQA